VDDFVEDTDKAYSDSKTGDMSAARIVKQRQGRTTDPPSQMVFDSPFQTHEKAFIID
jgi:hypothetical protein